MDAGEQKKIFTFISNDVLPINGSTVDLQFFSSWLFLVQAKLCLWLVTAEQAPMR